MKNNVNFTGRVGADVTIRTLNNGGKVASFRLATEESWKDKQTGEWKNRPTWHTIETFVPSKVAFLERNVRKGDLIEVMGMLAYDNYEKNGVEIERAKIVLRHAGHTVQKMPDGRTRAPAASQTSDQYATEEEIPF